METSNNLNQSHMHVSSIRVHTYMYNHMHTQTPIHCLTHTPTQLHIYVLTHHTTHHTSDTTPFTHSLTYMHAHTHYLWDIFDNFLRATQSNLNTNSVRILNTNIIISIWCILTILTSSFIMRSQISSKYWLTRSVHY